MSEDMIGSLPTAERKDYEFVGWYTSKSGGSKVETTTVVTSISDYALYAHWKKVKASKPSKPSLRQTGKKTAEISIKGASTAAGFQVRYGRQSNMKGAKTVSTKSRTYKMRKLGAKKTYYVQVRSYKLDSTGGKVYSQWGNKVKIRIK